MARKRMLINLIASIFSFATNLGINFFLTPFLVSKLGNEAFGFISLSNSFVNYIAVFAIALNAMAGRNITLEICKNNNENANIYFNSIFFMNIILSIVFSILSLIAVTNIENLLNISEHLTLDVKITFILVLVNFVMTLLCSVFNVATFCRNRFDLSSMSNIISYVIKLILIISLFYTLPAKIFFIVIGTLASTIFIGICNVYYTKSLLPQININLKHFKVFAVKSLLLTGLWYSINSLGSVLINDINLLIANLVFGGDAMGILSIAKTIPSNIILLSVVISGIFSPEFIMLFSKNKIEDLINQTKFSIKILSLIMSIPIAGFIAFGIPFFHLWLPAKSASEIINIYHLSLITIIPILFDAYTSSLFHVFVATEKIKFPSIVSLITSIINLVIIYFLIKYTNCGILAITGIGSILTMLRVLIFVPCYAACVLEIRKTTFYPIILRTFLSFLGILTIFLLMNHFILLTSWSYFLIIALIASLIGYCMNIFMLFNKSERLRIKVLIINRIKI